MSEPWSTRWYTPILVIGAWLLALLVMAVTGVGVLTAAVPRVVAPRVWTTSLVRVDEALAAGDAGAALSWWRDAHAAALRSGQWEGMIEVGDAARRLHAGPSLARQAYLTALFRARRQHSVDGLLRAAVGFGELGDHDVVAQALRMAAREAGPDARSNARIGAVADRWLQPLPATGRLDARPESRHPGGRWP